MKLDELATALKVAEQALKFVRTTLDDAALELSQLQRLYEEANRIGVNGNGNRSTSMDSSIHRDGRDEFYNEGIHSSQPSSI